MIRKIAAIVIGTFVAVAVIAAVEFIGHQVYPPPTNIDINDMDAMEAYAASMPVGALLFVGAAWITGAFTGGMLAAVIAQEAPITNCLVVGGLVLAGTIMTLISIPHPLWFSISSVATLIGSIFLTTRVAGIVVKSIAKEQSASG